MSQISRCFLLLAAITLWTNIVNVSLSRLRRQLPPQDPPDCKRSANALGRNTGGIEADFGLWRSGTD
jgi:hypothetical protein